MNTNSKDEILGWIFVIMISVILGILGWSLLLYVNKQLYGQPSVEMKSDQSSACSQVKILAYSMVVNCNLTVSS